MNDQQLIEFLDELVHDSKAEEAADINNQGLESQLQYLGLTREQAEKQAQEN